MEITPKFEAQISADIKKFMKKAGQVDDKIREMATGVVIDFTAQIQDFMSDAARVQDRMNDIDRTVDVTVNGNISDLQRAIDEANAQIAALNDAATVNINGNNSGFNNAAGDVNKTARNLRRRVTEARIGANIGEFENRMVEVARALTEADGTVTPRIQLDINRFQTEILEVEDRMRELSRATADPEVEADIAGFMAQMILVQTQLNAVAQIHDIDIRADTGRAHARLSALWLQIKSLTVRDFVVRMRTSVLNYQNAMGSIANFSRSIGEVMAMTGRGIMISLSPAIIPLLGSVVSLVGNLGPMIGTLAGSTFALATSMGAAVLGLGGFAAVAVPTIKDLFTIDEAVKRGSKQWYAMSEETRNAVDSIDAFQGNWGKFRETMDKPVTTAFTDFMQASNKLLNLFKPAIESSVEAMGNLMKSLESAAGGKQVKSFFEWLGTSAGEHLETIFKALGNFMLGFMNMMTAFGPLASETAAGFGDMAQRFADWTAGFSENKKFQAFIDYVSENMPKIRNIFGDAFKGIINTFAVFAPFSSDMMTSLQEMMAGFKEWSSTLESNQGFQNFMAYLQETGPKVVEFLGNLRDFFWELATALAPAGEMLLGMVSKILEFTAALIDNHPWVGKMIAAVVVLGGAFLAILPHIVLMQAAFGGIIGKIILMTLKTIWAAAVQVAKWIWMGITATLNAIKIAAAWTFATGKAMVIAVAKMIASAAIFIARWVAIAVQATLNAVRVAAAWAFSTGTAMVVAVAKMIASAAVFVAKWAVIGAKALFQAAKVAAAWLLSTGAAMATAVAGMIATAAVFVAKWVWMGAQALLQAARMAAAWFIALGPIGWVIGAIVGLAILVIANWDKIKAKTIEIWNKISESVQKAWQKVKEKTQEAVLKVVAFIAKLPGEVSKFTSKMLSAGKDLIQGLIDGAVGMASDAIGAVKRIAGDMVDAALSFFKIKSPSRVFMEMGAYLSEGLAVGVSDKAQSAISSVESVARGMSNAFNPQLALADMRATAQLDTSINRADMGVVRKSFAAEVGPVDVNQGDIHLEINGRTFAKFTANDMKREMESNEKQQSVSRRGHN